MKNSCGTISSERGTVHDVADTAFIITICEPVDTRVVLDESSTVMPASATGVDIRVKRTINANEWSTICLPFAMTEAQIEKSFGDNVQIGDFTGYDAETDGANEITDLKLNFSLVTSIDANHPYVIKTTTDLTEFCLDGVNIAPEEEPCVEQDNGRTGRNRQVYSGFYGTYTAGLSLADLVAVGDCPLFLSNSKLYYATKDTLPMKAYRAYFWLSDVLTDMEDYSSHITMSFDDDSITGISEIFCDTENGYYNLQGLPVETPTKGIYIHNGKVVLVK